jgi:hypothetical protein
MKVQPSPNPGDPRAPLPIREQKRERPACDSPGLLGWSAGPAQPTVRRSLERLAIAARPKDPRPRYRIEAAAVVRAATPTVPFGRTGAVASA